MKQGVELAQFQRTENNTCYPMYTRQTLLSTDQQIAGHGFSVNHDWMYDAAIMCLVQIAAVCSDWIYDQIQYTKKVGFGILSSENAALQLLTATEKSAKLGPKMV